MSAIVETGPQNAPVDRDDDEINLLEDHLVEWPIHCKVLELDAAIPRHTLTIEVELPQR